jgi:hypothetical protein
VVLQPAVAKATRQSAANGAKRLRMEVSSL